MSFSGFDAKTNDYFFEATLDNTRAFFERNRQIFTDYVKAPLSELHEELVPTALEIDSGICTVRTRCISKAFNDFRYAGKTTPVKTYCYLHFCATVPNESEDTPGLFFDASYDGYRYGFCVYHNTNVGMVKIRDYILKNKAEFKKIISKLSGYCLVGEDYKKDHYPDEQKSINLYLNKKYFYLCKEFEPNDRYFSPKLADELKSAFLELAPMYKFVSAALREKKI